MKECNGCLKNCHPKGPRLISNLPCKEAQTQSPFPFRECISKVSFGPNVSKELVKWILAWN